MSRPPTAVPLSGEPLCLDLVNTTFIDRGLRGRPVDALSTPSELDARLAEWAPRLPEDLREALRRGGADTSELDAFRQLRAAIRQCLHAVLAGASTAPPAVMLINQCAAWAGHDILIGGDTLSRQRWRPVADPRRAAAGELATDAIQLLTGPDAVRIRVCPAPGCILFFLGTHPRRRWCTDTCGNRVRVARHDRPRPET